MTATAIVILVIVVVVVAGLVAFAITYSRRRALRERFGPEYERLVAEQNSRSAAEHELRERERRHAELDLRPLPESSRTGYAAEWADVQTRFVDSPQDAVRAGADVAQPRAAGTGADPDAEVGVPQPRADVPQTDGPRSDAPTH
jgi:hypothetical protein